MARVKIEDIINHLSDDLKIALEQAIRQADPNTKVNRETLFNAFGYAVRRKC